jgi:hypothetical protein
MSEFLSRYQSENRDSMMSELAALFRKICDIIVSHQAASVFRSGSVIRRNVLETVFVSLGILIRQQCPLGDINLGIKRVSDMIDGYKELRSATTSTAVLNQRIELALDAFRG